jgi:hypothetical protein
MNARNFLSQQRLAVAGVSPKAVEFCRRRGINVVADGCPMMYGEGVDLGHTGLRWILKLTSEFPE